MLKIVRQRSIMAAICGRLGCNGQRKQTLGIVLLGQEVGFKDADVGQSIICPTLWYIARYLESFQSDCHKI